MSLKKSLLIITLLVLADQAIKIYMKTHLMLEEDIVVASWFRLHFTENVGMAFSMVLPGAFGKLALSMFRTIAAIGGLWYLTRLIKTKAHWGFILSVCLILAGTIGNLIDGMFYGLIFGDSHYRIAEVFPKEGYAGFMQGNVVDMFWFPLFNGHYPNWVPRVGGQSFQFFPAIFNVADAAITVGVIIILFFQGVFFKEERKEGTVTETIGA